MTDHTEQQRCPYPEHVCEGCDAGKLLIVSPRSSIVGVAAIHSPEGWVCMKYVSPEAYRHYEKMRELKSGHKGSATEPTPRVLTAEDIERIGKKAAESGALTGARRQTPMSEIPRNIVCNNCASTKAGEECDDCTMINCQCSCTRKSESGATVETPKEPDPSTPAQCSNCDFVGTVETVIEHDCYGAAKGRI